MRKPGSVGRHEEGGEALGAGRLRRCGRRRRRDRRCRRWRSRSSRRRARSRRRRASRSCRCWRRPSRIAARSARRRRSPRRCACACSHCCCSALPNRLIGAGAEALHGEGEIGEPVVARQRLAHEAQRAHVERRRARPGRARYASASRRGRALHQLAAGGVDIVVIDRQIRRAPALERSASARWRSSKNGQARKARVSHSIRPRTPASAWRRTRGRRARNPRSACRSPAPALRPRSPGRGSSTIPD